MAISAAAARYRFHDPDGHVMEIYYEEQKYVAPPELHSNLKNLPQKFTGRGAGVRRIDHLALLAKDVEANRKFAQDLLGFQLREQVRFDEGKTEIGSWMSPTAIHHQLAYVVDVKGAHGRLHHFSMWVDNRDDVMRAADILTENGIFIEAGPSKHNNSQGFYLYSYEPGGNRVEVYSVELPGGGARLGAGDLERRGARHRHLLGRDVAGQLHPIRHARCGRRGRGAGP